MTTAEHRVLSTVDEGGIAVRLVPQAGMVATSLLHRGEELLGQRGGLEAYVAERKTMGIPLLYPWANRLEGMRLDVAGREVVLDRISPPLRVDDNGLPMHGLLAGLAGYRYAQVFAPSDDDVIAFEPMTAPTNALVDGGAELPVLAPGESYQAGFAITLADGA